MEPSRPTYRVVTLGCKLNQADGRAVGARLARLGLARAAGGDDPDAAADLIVLNTCTVTGNADREARQIARRLRRANPRALLIATGCYAQRDGNALGAVDGIDHVVGLTAADTRIAEIARAAFRLGDPPREDLGASGETAGCDPDAGAADRTRFYLKVQDGCDLRCSYCIIPSVRGAGRSVPAEEIVRRIEDLARHGYREIVFTGVNTGDWGRDLDPPLRLAALVDQALAVPGLGRLRLNSLEPKTVTPDLIERFARFSGRLAPHLQVPLQSGCDTVLARMRRPYRTSDYARVVAALRAAIPGVCVGADVIVGFPAESDAEFDATCRFIETCGIDYLHVFPYSARPGTPAASLPGQVPPAVIKERGARLRDLAAASSLRFRRRFLGEVRQTLTLRALRPDGRLRALTDNFIDVGIDVRGRDAEALMNRLVAARITAADARGTDAALAS